MALEEQILIDILEEGVTNISNLLLSNYKKVGLSDQDLVLLIHLIHYKSKNNHFPSISLLEDRMSTSTEELMRVLQRLVSKGYIIIEEHKDGTTGVIFEKYNITPVYLKLIKVLGRNMEINKIEEDKKNENKSVKNIYKIFEQEFGRALSPIEIELILTWIDKDKHSEDVIIYALKEAVFSNKLNFRYIDGILFEWQKKNIKTIDQIRQHVKNYRDNKSRDNKIIQDSNSFEFYNWLEEKD